MDSLEEKCIRSFGVDSHFLTYLSPAEQYAYFQDEEHWRLFTEDCKSGKLLKHYERAFKNDPEIVILSNPQKVARINELVDRLLTAARERNRTAVGPLYVEIALICGRDPSRYADRYLRGSGYCLKGKELAQC